MHTKGPWVLGADLEGVITDYRDENGNSSPENYLRNGYVKTVCKLTHAKWAEVGEHVANGKLIAAAPTMLAALLHAKANMPHPDQMIDDAIAMATAE